jgi:hypothetical protein
VTLCILTTYTVTSYTLSMLSISTYTHNIINYVACILTIFTASTYTPNRYIFIYLISLQILSQIILSKLITSLSAYKTKYMVMYRDQNKGRIHSVRMDNSTFERVEEFKYLGTTLTNQNAIQEKIKSRLMSKNASYYSVQNFCLRG